MSDVHERNNKKAILVIAASPEMHVDLENARGSGAYIAAALLSLAIFAASIALGNAPISFALLTGIMLVASLYDRFAIAAALCFLVFQNTFLAVFSPYFIDISVFSLAQGASYVVLVVIFAKLSIFNVELLKRGNLYFFVALFILFLFMAIGVIRSNLISAAAYFRLFSVPIVAITIGIYYKNRLHRSFVNEIITAITWIVLVIIFLEIIANQLYYQFINMVDFQKLKSPDDYSLSDLSSFLETSQRSLFNLTGSLRLDTLVPIIYGPVLHPISSAYVVAALGLAMWFYGKRLPFVLCMATLFFISAKGPLALLILPVLAPIALRYLKRWTVPLTVGAYIALVFVYGMFTNDIHVWGLLAGIRSLASHPWGEGLGVGGNLSLGVQQLKAVSARLNLSTLTTPLESAIGVMIFQVGVVALVILYWIWRRLSFYIMLQNPRHRTFFATALLMLLTNGLFQEEAFAPAAFGFGAIVLLLLMGRGNHQNLDRAQPSLR